MSDDDVKTEKTEAPKDEATFAEKAKSAAKRIKEKGKKLAKDTANYVADHTASGMVKVATVATLATTLAPTDASAATPGDYNKEGSTQMAKDLNYQYADNKDLHFRPVTEEEAARLGASVNKGSRTASFTQARQQMSSRTSRTSTSTRQQASNDGRFADPYVASFVAKYEAGHPGQVCVLSELDNYKRTTPNPYTGHPGYCAILEVYDENRPALDPKIVCVSNDALRAKEYETFELNQVRQPVWMRDHLRRSCTFHIYGFDRAMSILHGIDHVVHGVGRIINGVQRIGHAPAGPRRSPSGRR